MTMTRGTVTQVADDVFVAHGTDCNWILLRDGTDVTLIDSGYPGDVDVLEASIREIGAQPQDVQAVLITHAHVDHVGGARKLHERYGTPALTDPIEVAHARRERLEQANELDIARNLWRPGVLPWTLRILRVGAKADVTLWRRGANRFRLEVNRSFARYVSDFLREAERGL